MGWDHRFSIKRPHFCTSSLSLCTYTRTHRHKCWHVWDFCFFSSCLFSAAAQKPEKKKKIKKINNSKLRLWVVQTSMITHRSSITTANPVFTLPKIIDLRSWEVNSCSVQATLTRPKPSLLQHIKCRSPHSCSKNGPPTRWILAERSPGCQAQTAEPFICRNPNASTSLRVLLQCSNSPCKPRRSQAAWWCSMKPATISGVAEIPKNDKTEGTEFHR